MSDLIEGKVTPNVGNATCNAGGKLLKVVEMQYKYGTQGPGQRKTLVLAMEEDCDSNHGADGPAVAERAAAKVSTPARL